MNHLWRTALTVFTFGVPAFSALASVVIVPADSKDNGVPLESVKEERPIASLGRCAPLVGQRGSEPFVAARADWPGHGILIDQSGGPHLKCNAIIVAPNWALTLEFCVSRPETEVKEGLQVTAHGRAGEESRAVVRMVREPSSGSTVDSFQRLVMLELDKALEGVDPVLLSDRQIDAAVLREGACTVMVGEGIPAGSNETGFHEIPVPVVGAAQCAASDLGDAQLDGRSLCTGYESGSPDGCLGFAGAALMVPAGRMGWRAVGLVAWGKDCGEPGQYTVSTQISPALQWIESVRKGTDGDSKGQSPERVTR